MIRIFNDQKFEISILQYYAACIGKVLVPLIIEHKFYTFGHAKEGKEKKLLFVIELS